MSAAIDARSLPAGTVLTPDLAIIGGGPAGISLALSLANSGHDILLLESGGTSFEDKAQLLYSGSQTGVPYTALDAGRLRALGGGTNHWGGWCRPMDAIDFEAKPWMPHSGWPITRAALEPYFAKAQSLVEAGPWIYDRADALVADNGPLITLAPGGAYTSWFQFSRTRGDVLPTHFGERYRDDLTKAEKIKPLLHANVTAIRLARNGAAVSQLDLATLNEEGGLDNRLTVRPRFVVLAAGGMENARLLLASNDVMNVGIGNQNDMVGRFFADNPIPRDTATLVLFAGAVHRLLSQCPGAAERRRAERHLRAHTRLRPRQGRRRFTDHGGKSCQTRCVGDCRRGGNGASAGGGCLQRQGLFAGLRHGAGARS